MTGHERNRISQMTLVVADIERISDHAENIVEYENQVKSKNSKLSDEAIEELRTLATLSLKTIAFCIDIFRHIHVVYICYWQTNLLSFKADMKQNTSHS